MKEIPIWAGKGNFPILIGFAEVDEAHAVPLSRFHWTLNKFGYVKRHERGNIVFLHQDVAKLMLWPDADTLDIDHIDRNKLNCQSGNLRVVTRSVNCANSGIQSNNTSGFIGVSWNEANQKWQAEITVNQKRMYLGRYKDIHEAARKVNSAYRYHFPQVAIPNPEVESNGDEAPRISGTNDVQG